MEFEKNTPATAEDIALAEVPHRTVQPAHGDIRADVVNVPTATRPDNRNFEFETESTAEAALSTSSTSHHPHHKTAVLLSAGTALLFVAVLAALYLTR